jgi:membrane-associated phospholipid phosphatase
VGAARPSRATASSRIVVPVRPIRVILLACVATTRAAAIQPAPLPLAAPVESPAPLLSLDPDATGLLAEAVFAAWGLGTALEAREVRACRWCEPGGLDLRARKELRWSDPAAAGEISNVLQLAVPLGSATAVAWLAARGGGSREVVEDVLAIAATVALADSLTTAMKHGTARLRPEPWASGRAPGEGDLHSFFSGHTSRVFAAAAAATQVARLRRRPGWRWLAAAAFGASATTAWLRVAADQHWATDVLAGAAASTALGLAVPPLMLRRRAGARGPSIAPAPGGVSIVF